MRAVIVAAGKSSRLYPLTKKLPKCMLEIGGKSLILRSIETLRSYRIDEICIIVGFQKEKILNHLGNEFKYIFNSDYEINNNMASLGFAKTFATGKPFVYLHSDLLYHPGIINLLNLSEESNVLMVDHTSNDPEAMKVLVKDGLFIKSNKQIPLEESYGEWLGISKFSSNTSKKLFDIIEGFVGNEKNKSYDTFAFNRLVEIGEVLRVKDVNGLPWIEIDNHEDLRIAQETIVRQIDKN